jgi:hypothetical protein
MLALGSGVQAAPSLGRAAAPPSLTEKVHGAHFECKLGPTRPGGRLLHHYHEGGYGPVHPCNPRDDWRLREEYREYREYRERRRCWINRYNERVCLD